MATIYYIVTRNSSLKGSRARANYLLRRSKPGPNGALYRWDSMLPRAEAFTKYDTAYRLARRYGGHVEMVNFKSIEGRKRVYTNTNG